MTGALERSQALLLADARAAARPIAGGRVLDVLGDGGEPPVRTLSQRLMRTTPLAAVYERWWRPGLGRLFMLGPGPAEEQRIARSLLRLRPGDGVLDVACGTGAFTRAFAEAVGEEGLAVGLDASRPMLAQAAGSDGAETVAWVRGDATRLPFRDASFDAVCCFAALYLIDDPEGALDEMARVITPGGCIALLSSARPDHPLLRLVDRPAALAAGVRMFERGELTRALERRGFGDITRDVRGLAQFVGARRIVER